MKDHQEDEKQQNSGIESWNSSLEMNSLEVDTDVRGGVNETIPKNKIKQQVYYDKEITLRDDPNELRNMENDNLIETFSNSIESTIKSCSDSLSIQRNILLTLNYAVVIFHVLALFLVFLFGYTTTIFLSCTQIICLIFNIYTLVFYHVKGSNAYLEVHTGTVTSQSLFNTFIAPVVILGNGLISTILIITQFESIGRVNTCLFLCIIEIQEFPAWGTFLVAFILNAQIYASAGISFLQGISNFQYLDLLQSRDTLIAIRSSGLYHHIHQRKVSRMELIKTIALLMNFGMMLTQIPHFIIYIGVVLMTIIWASPLYYTYGFLLLGICTFVLTILFAVTSIHLHYKINRMLAIISKIGLLLAILFTTAYSALLFSFLIMYRKQFSDFTTYLVSLLCVVYMIKVVFLLSAMILQLVKVWHSSTQYRDLTFIDNDVNSE